RVCSDPSTRAVPWHVGPARGARPVALLVLGELEVRQVGHVRTTESGGKGGSAGSAAESRGQLWHLLPTFFLAPLAFGLAFGLLLTGLERVSAALLTLFALLALPALLPSTTAATGTRHPRHAWHSGHTAAALHLAHHLLRLEETGDQAVDVADLRTGTIGDTQTAGSVDRLGVGTFTRCHRLDDGLDTVQVLVVDALDLFPHLPHTGHHPQQVPDRAELADHRHLLEKVVQREVVVRGHGRGHLLDLGLVERALCLFDECEHITHVQDARSHPVRVEQVEVLHLLPGGGEHDGTTGDVSDGQRRTTAGVTVELGEGNRVVA